MAVMYVMFTYILQWHFKIFVNYKTVLPLFYLHMHMYMQILQEINDFIN